MWSACNEVSNILTISWLIRDRNFGSIVWYYDKQCLKANIGVHYSNIPILVSYKVVRDENGNVKLKCPAIGKQFAAEEISAQVLRKLVEDASKFLNDEVSEVVITLHWYIGRVSIIKLVSEFQCVQYIDILDKSIKCKSFWKEWQWETM